MDHAANIFTTLMVVEARWAGCRGDHMVCGGLSAPGVRTCRQAQVLSGVITENPQTNKFKQSVFANMCWCLFKAAIVCSFDTDKGVYMHIAKQREQCPAGHVSVTLNVTYCHVSIFVTKTPTLSSGSWGVWVVLRRPGTNWINGQHATIRVWSIFEGLFPPLKCNPSWPARPHVAPWDSAFLL